MNPSPRESASQNDPLLHQFGQRQAALRHRPMYWLSIPMLILGLVGLLWSLPVPSAFGDISPALNWGTAFLLAAVVYYFIISLPLAFGMLPLVIAVAGFNLWLQLSPFSSVLASLGLIGGGILGLIASRFGGGGGIREVTGDLMYLMLAPMWLLSRLYRRMGIPV